MIFPTLNLTTLSGRSITIPYDLNDLAILALPTSRYQQDECNQWAALMPQVKAINPDVSYYEIPTISWYWYWMKPMMDRGMKAALTPAEQDITACFFGNTTRLFEELGHKPSVTTDVYFLYKNNIVAHYTSIDDAKLMLETIKEFTSAETEGSGVGT